MNIINNVGYVVGGPPLNPKEGDMYFDTTTNKNNIHHKGKWFELKFNFPKKFQRIEKIKAILN